MAAAFAAAPILAGVLVASTAVAAGAGVFAAIRQSQAQKAQAEAEEQRQTSLAIQGTQRQNEILEEEINTIAAVNVGAAASGIDPFSGAPASAKRNISARANRQLRVSRLETATGIAGSQATARQLRRGAEASLIGGFARTGSAVGGVTGQLQQIG